MKRIQPVTVLLLALILVLGYSLVTRQRREARLRAALGLYRTRAQHIVQYIMGKNAYLAWPQQVPLSEVIETVESATIRWYSLFPKGVPIYVDPEGLREAGRSLNSLVQETPRNDPQWDELPLRQQLRIILEPLGLAAEVKNGAIVITSRNRVDESAALDEETEP